jgi:hypothetical protein
MTTRSNSLGLAARSKHILVLWWRQDGERLRPTIRQHLRTLSASTRGHHIHYHNVRQGIPLGLRLFPFDAIVLHTTLLGLRWSPRFASIRRKLAWLKTAPGVKIALPQDEYDHAHVLDEWLAEMKVNVVASIFDEPLRAHLYPTGAGGAEFLRCHTGYIDEPTAQAIAPALPRIAERPLDLVYRACRLPFWFGAHGQLKHQISEIFSKQAAELGLKYDISTRGDDTIVTNDWFTFLASSKATIGCESGSSVLDRRGEMQALLRAMLSQEPHLTFAQASRRLPAGWDSHRFFAMGPRHLEAVITRTCQVLVAGEYDGVLHAHRHYIPVRRDFHDLDEVLHKLRDHALLQATADRAYEEIYLRDRKTYGAFAETLDGILDRTAVPCTGAVRAFAPLLRCNLWFNDRVSTCARALRRVVRPAYHLARQTVPRAIRAVFSAFSQFFA